MPSQLVHIAYAKVFLKEYPEYDKSVFMRGTTFPDIRRMAGLPREATHRYGLKRSDVSAESSAWKAGLLLHSFLDEAWNAYFAGLGLYVDEELTEKTWTSVKIAEEAALCGLMEGREEVARALGGAALPEELAFGPTPDMLERWHAFIIWKLNTPFDLDRWREHAVEVDFEAAKMERLLDRVEIIQHDVKWQERLRGLHEVLGI